MWILLGMQTVGLQVVKLFQLGVTAWVRLVGRSVCVSWGNCGKLHRIAQDCTGLHNSDRGAGAGLLDACYRLHRLHRLYLQREGFPPS